MSEEKKIGISNSDRAHVLVQAMPYIKKWAGETIVVKYGGNAMINPELKEAVMNDIVLMQLVGVNVVLVHGGGPEISGMLKKIGKESRFVGGMRYTDAETMDIVQQVLAGKVNKDLVQLLENTGGKAVGLCGLDGSMLKAQRPPDRHGAERAGHLRRRHHPRRRSRGQELPRLFRGAAGSRHPGGDPPLNTTIPLPPGRQR